MLLTKSNPKLLKSLSLGYVSFGLSLAPNITSGYQTCAKASPACAAECLFYAGRGAFQRTQDARIRKTQWFFEDRSSFLAALEAEIDSTSKKILSLGMIPVYRPNVDSDLPWEKFGIIQNFPHLQFYDYTKVFGRKVPDNYHLTFSRSEINDYDCRKAIAAGMNVAVVFERKPPDYFGLPVIDGDEHDLRFLDPQGVVVGLKPKGRARHSTSGFVVRNEETLAWAQI